MSSIKEFVAKTLCPALIEDTRRHRIFNEADHQARTSYHLQKGYVERHEGGYLLHEPHIAIGRGRGTTKAKPDIMMCDFRDGPWPFAAIELKCYLEDTDTKVPTIFKNLSDDIENLKKAGHRFETLKNVFSIALLDMEDTDQFNTMSREFRRITEDWQKHFLKVHLINMRSEIKRGYDRWADEWNARLLCEYRSIISKPEVSKDRGLKQALSNLLLGA